MLDVQTMLLKQTNTHYPHSLGIVKPLQHFLSNDLENVKSSKKTYHKTRTENAQLLEKYGQVVYDSATVSVVMTFTCFIFV